MKSFVDFLYTIAVGFAAAVLVGFGLWSLQSSPKYPDYPAYLAYPTAPTYPTYTYSYEEQQAYTEKQKAYEKEVADYDSRSKQMASEFDNKVAEFNKADKDFKNKSARLALVAGVCIFSAGLFLIRKNGIIGEGLALGGIFAATYSVGLVLMADSKKFAFGIVTGIFIMLIVLVLQRPLALKQSASRTSR